MNLFIFVVPPRSTYQNKSLLTGRKEKRANAKYANIATITGKQEKKTLVITTGRVIFRKKISKNLKSNNINISILKVRNLVRYN